METKIITINPNQLHAEHIKIAGDILSSGGIVAFPTETVYGLGANALDADAVKRTFAAKGRPSDNPLIVHLAERNDIGSIAREISASAQRMIDAFMPGPFTVILKKQPQIPDCVTAGLDTVAVRIPSHPVAHALIAAAGVPVSAPSANLSGKPSPTEARHVIEDMDGRVECIIDGGACTVGVESTVVDASGKHPVILRPGGVTFEQLRAVVPDIQIDEHVLKSVSAEETPKCPGMKYRHYAPDADVIVVEGQKERVQAKIAELLAQAHEKKTGVLTMYDSSYPADLILSAGNNNQEYAQRLFSHLRRFDEFGIEIVFAEFCEQDGYGLAVRNRLYKAAGNHVIKV